MSYFKDVMKKMNKTTNDEEAIEKRKNLTKKGLILMTIGGILMIIMICLLVRAINNFMDLDKEKNFGEIILPSFLLVPSSVVFFIGLIMLFARAGSGAIAKVAQITDTTVECQYCHAQINISDSKCPNCGAPNQQN